jgi:hypothetical protein
MKLGKKDPINKEALLFSDYTLLLPTVPLVDTAPAYAYPMDLNDQYGDCVVAGFDHLRQTVTGLLTGTPQNFTTEQLEAFYKTQNPNFPQEDNGMDIQTFLEYLQANKHIVAFAKIDQTNEQEMKAATYMGLSIMTGFQIQEAQEEQFNEGKPWVFVEGSPIAGGHCIVPVGYQSTPDQSTYVTWGKEQQVDQSFLTQCDEAWFVLLQEHIDNPTFRNHWNLEAFAQSVREITDGKIIIPIPPTVPPQNTMVITREADNGVETLGTFIATNVEGQTLSEKTLERPWKDNEANVSCIPTGTYACSMKPFYETEHYEVLNVPGRTGIFIHPGNFYTDSEGCILLGLAESDINGDNQLDVTSSVTAVSDLETLFNRKDFTLTIQ